VTVVWRHPHSVIIMRIGHLNLISKYLERMTSLGQGLPFGTQSILKKKVWIFFTVYALTHICSEALCEIVCAVWTYTYTTLNED
jgi:hypothetical protein